MSVVYITSLTGHSPYDITICDTTRTFCSVVETGVASVPPTLELTIPEFDGKPLFGEVLVIATDANGCEEMTVVSCNVTPTPTRTTLATPTPTQTPVKCRCYTLSNPTSSNISYSINLCDDVRATNILNPYTTITLCGYNPVIDPTGVITTNNIACSLTQSCSGPTPTPTKTPTPTPTLPSFVGIFRNCLS